MNTFRARIYYHVVWRCLGLSETTPTPYFSSPNRLASHTMAIVIVIIDIDTNINRRFEFDYYYIFSSLHFVLKVKFTDWKRQRRNDSGQSKAY